MQHDAEPSPPTRSPLQIKFSAPPPPAHQRRISIKKWHQVLGDIRYMALDPPGVRYLLSHTQESLRHVKGKMVTLKKGLHAALSDFRWMEDDP